MDLGVDVDEAARVHEIVRTVKDPLVFHLLGMSRLGQLVVGATYHDVHVQDFQCVIVEDGPQGARSENVGIDSIDLAGFHGFRPELLHHDPDLVLIDVRDGEPSALLRKVLAEEIPHMPAPLYRHVLTCQGSVPILVEGRRLHSLIDPVSCDR